MNTHDRIPEDWPVQPLDDTDPRTLAIGTRCGTCGLYWDDSVVTSLTPAPAARCPFEPFHVDPEILERYRIPEEPRTTVRGSGRVAIKTRFLGPTDTLGSRIRVHRADTSPTGDPLGTTWSWDYALDVRENHVAAVSDYLAKQEAAGHAWSGDWVLGDAGDGYVAVRIP